MKKVSYLVLTALFAVCAGFVSCSDDDDGDETLNPTIDVKVTAGSDSKKAINSNDVLKYDQGEDMVLDIDFTMGADKLTHIKIVSVISGKSFTMIDSALNEGWLNSGDKKFAYTYKTNVGNSKEDVTISTTDRKSRETKFFLTIEPNAPEAEDGFITSEATLMGAQSNATYGSFYSVDLAKVLTIGAANGQQSFIDFVYFYGSSNKATIAAPNESDLSQIRYGTTDVSKWTTKNATKFAKIADADIEDPAEWYDNAMTLVESSSVSKANDLAKGDVVAYKTSGNKTGAFAVTEITGQNNAGSISIILVTKEVK